MSQAPNENQADADGGQGPPYFGMNVQATSGYTVEGAIQQEVALFRGVRRVGGWRKWFVYGFVLLFGGAALAGVIYPLILWVRSGF